jgi:predicted Zn-dependent protease
MIPHLICGNFILRILFTVALIATSSLIQATQSILLPSIGDPTTLYVGFEEERSLGLEIMWRLRARELIIEDAQLNAYLDSIGQSIANHSENHGIPITFLLLRSNSINSFALPYNFIGINSGLIIATECEDELAGVIAHEIAHVSQRHVIGTISDMRQMALPMAVAMIISATIAATSKQGSQAAMIGTLAAGAQHQISFTRANEQEADRVGRHLLAKSGFNPLGISNFFIKLERQSDGFENHVPEMLLTHPRPESRISDIQDPLEVIPQKSIAATRDSKAYAFAKARVVALTTGDIQTLLQKCETLLGKGDLRDEATTRYSYAIALRQAGRYKEAQQQISLLQRKDPNRLAFYIEAAEIALAKGEIEQAWRLFEKTQLIYPDNFALAMHYGQALATHGDPKRALYILKPYLNRHHYSSLLYETYARAAQRTGDMLTTHTAMAEYHYINGELLLAIEHLELGMQTVGILTNEKVSLSTRLKQFRAEATAQKLPR